MGPLFFRKIYRPLYGERRLGLSGKTADRKSANVGSNPTVSIFFRSLYIHYNGRQIKKGERSMDLVNVSKGGLFDRTIVSPAIKRALKKRLGVKPDVKVGITHKEGADGKVSLYLDLEMHMTKSEYEKLKTFIETM